MTLPAVEKRLAAWREEHAAAALLSAAESLSARRDAATLLEFVRDEKVVGTQGSGNMPLKAIRVVTARFVDPPELEYKIGDKVRSVRSEEDVSALHYLRILAETGSLLKTGSARRWRLTANGARFLETDPLVQTVFLLAVWWRKVNWQIAYPFEGLGKSLPDSFEASTMDLLLSLPTRQEISFEKFASELVRIVGLTWSAPNPEIAKIALNGAVNNMVIRIQAYFGVVESHYREEKRGKATVSTLESFEVTELGAALLQGVYAAVT